jgi:hypothetical protein
MDPRVAALVTEYVKAEAAITRLVVEALTSGKLGSKKFRKQKQSVLAGLLHKLDAAGVPQAKQIVKTAYSVGAEEARRVVKVKPVGAMQSEAIDLLQENLTSRLGEATSTVGRRVDDVFRREGLRIASAQLGDERTVGEATQRLVNELAKQGVTGFTDKRGANWGLEGYAAMAVRTTTSEAVNQGVATTMLSRGFDLVIVEGPHDITDQCKAYVGKVFSLSGNAKGYPHLDRLPPFHGNCRHFIRPAREALAERTERMAA